MVGLVAYVAGATQQSAQVEEANLSDTSIIFRGKDGRVLSWDEVKATEGPVRYEILGPETVPQKAKTLHDQGREAGSEGNYRVAIDFFEQASRIIPDWPYPIYDEAFSYLMLRDWDEAERLYSRVNEMAPRGFFTVQTALDHLRRERQGKIPRGTYLSLVLVEFEPDTSAKIDAIHSILINTPGVPRAWQMLAVLEQDNDAKLHAISQGLKYDPDPETKGMLLIYKAQVLRDQKHEKEAIELLGELATNPQSPMDIEHLSKLILRNMLEK